MSSFTSLPQRLRTAGRRQWAIGSGAATAWAIFAASALLVLGVWLDLLWEISPEWRVAMLGIALVVAAAALAKLLWQTGCNARPGTLARRLDLAAGSGGEIVTGLDLWNVLRRGAARRLTTGLSHIAVQRAATVAQGASLSKAVPMRPLGRAAIAAVGFTALMGLACVVSPDLVSTEWQRFSQPWADVPPYSPLRFTVKPGDVEVLYGGELEISATVEGGAVDRLELVLQGDGDEPTRLPMFSESDGSWRAVLSKLTEPTEYFVQAYRARSPKYCINILAVPQLEGVRVQVSPPDYAGQAPLEGPVPEGGVKGLRGTRVTVWATSNRPLSGGTLALSSREKAGQPRRPATTVSMTPTEPGAQEAVGRFEIEADGRFECRVTDEEGRVSQQAFSANITLVADQHPLVRIVEPQAMSLATPTAQLPVTLSAEDDCGVSRLQLFRSLNDSRPLPADLKLPRKWPHRCDQQVVLPMAAYGLSPGDTIKLFARVEDNDPAGTKGAESQVVSVRIISQAEFERMFQMQQGIEVLLSKYRDATRRMEALGERIDQLRKEIEKQPDGPLADKARQELRRLQDQLKNESAAIRKSAGQRLPFDLDAALAPELDKLARMTEEMAKELEKLEKSKSLLKDDLVKKLDEMAKRLDQGRRKYQDGAMQPLEHLEAIFPLIVDQERFVVLVLRQKDLAQRMASLKGHDGEDNPSLRGRMRDLEQEQQQVRVALADLLDDIQDHATRLPDRSDLRKLRETALAFAQDVRASEGAAPAMRSVESALSEFAGTRAHANAKEAAEILEQFLARCKAKDGLDGECQGALVFQPKLCTGMGNTVSQLLAAMGMGSGSGFGSGIGSYGLYGSMAGQSGYGSGPRGNASRGRTGSGAGVGAGVSGGANPDLAPSSDSDTEAKASSAGDAIVPLRYRRHVGQYFQRLAEELGAPPPQPNRRTGK